MRMLVVGLALAGLTVLARAEDWPCWRGPRGDGTSAESGLPTRWGPSENVAWKVPVPGKGHSSPIVVGERVLLTTCLEKEGKRCLLCLDRRDGRTLWNRTVLTAPLEGKHRLNSYASSTPASDGRHVWVTFYGEPDVIVACYDLNGQEIWRKCPGRFRSVHGFCSSPVLHKDLVIINCDQDAPPEEQAYVVGLEKETGRERWRIDRPNRTRSYCVPIVVETPGGPQLVLSGSKCVAAYDPDTGRQLWLIDGPTEQYVASLVYGEGLFFLTCGYPQYHLMGIRPDGRGNITGTEFIAWHEKGSGRYIAYVPSPIAQGKWFFVVSDEGYLTCLEARSGKHLWTERLGRRHSASPVAAGGLLYFPDDDGVTYVVRAADRFDLVAKNSVDEECYASPAVSGGQLFLRTVGHVYCIGERK
jgi:hypothetical protein